MLSQQSYFQSDCSFLTSRVTSIVMPRAYVPDLITANECTKNTAKFLLYQDKYCHQRCSTESRIQRNTQESIQNFLNTWCDHEIADSAQPRYRSIYSHQTLFPPCEGGVWARDYAHVDGGCTYIVWQRQTLHII